MTIPITMEELENWPALKTLSLEELQVRKVLNETLMRMGKHTPDRVKVFKEVNDILLLAIQAHPDTPKS